MKPCRYILAAAIAMLLAACATTPGTGAAPEIASPSIDAAASGIAAAELREVLRPAVGARPEFRACVGEAESAPAAQQCIGAEMQFQQGRLDAALASRRAKGGNVDAVQAQWLLERDRLCGNGAAAASEVQRIRSGICQLEATAARADALAR